MSAYIAHLRLPFQLLLSPIFLWGFLLAGGRPNPELLLAYSAFHLFGYAGGTALNSAYDRDTGPIGGMAHPPPVPQYLLAFSLVWQALGFGLVLLVNATLAAIYTLMFCLSLAYSHPATRWKGKPIAALLTVAAGQGVLACLAGWVTARGEAGSALSASGLLAITGVTLITTGFYPLTEIYQMDEDADRGDQTLAIWLGARGAFRFALTLIMAGGAAALWVVGQRYGVAEALLLGMFLAVVAGLIIRWARRFAPTAVMYNYRMVMGLYGAVTAGFIGWVGWHLFITGG